MSKQKLKGKNTNKTTKRRSTAATVPNKPIPEEFTEVFDIADYLAKM